MSLVVAPRDHASPSDEYARGNELARDSRVPRGRKLLLFLLVAYLALPFDLVPDFIPAVRQLDAAIIVALVLRSFGRGGGEPLPRELRPGPQQSINVVLRLSVGRAEAGQPVRQ